MKSKHTIYTFLVILLMINVASAGFFDNLRYRYTPQQPRSQPISNPTDDFKTLYDEVLRYNTPQNINLLGGYMQNYGVSVIKIHVVELNRDFYILKGVGIVSQTSFQVDKTIKLTRPQIRRIESFIADGQLSQFEQWQLWIMYKSG